MTDRLDRVLDKLDTLSNDLTEWKIEQTKINTGITHLASRVDTIGKSLDKTELNLEELATRTTKLEAPATTMNQVRLWVAWVGGMTALGMTLVNFFKPGA